MVSPLSQEILVENLHDKVTEQLKEAHVAEAQGLLETAPEKDRESILKQVAESLQQNKALTEAQRQQITTNLDLLRSRTGILPKPEVAQVSVDQNAVPPTVAGRMSKLATDVVTDFREGSALTKAGYIAGGVVGFLLVRWLWRKAFGEGKKEGFVKKGLKWMLALGAAGAGVLGAKSVMDWWNRKTSAPNLWSGAWNMAAAALGFSPATNPDGSPKGPEGPASLPIKAIGSTLNAGRDIAQGAGDVVTKAVTLGYKDVKFWVDLAQKKDGGEMLEHIKTAGYILAYENAEFVVRDIAGNFIYSFKKNWDWITTGAMPEDYFLVWGGTGAAYFLTKNAYTLFVRGQIPTALRLTRAQLLKNALQIGAGPLAPAFDVVRTAYIARQAGGVDALKIYYFEQSIVGKIRQWSKTRAAVHNLKTEQDAMRAVEEWAEWTRKIEIVKEFDDFGFTQLFNEKYATQLEDIKHAYAKSIQGYLKKMKVTPDTPELLSKLHAHKDLSQLKHFEEEMDNLRAALLNTPVETPPGAKAAETGADVAGATKAAETGTDAATPAKAAEGTTEAADAAKATEATTDAAAAAKATDTATDAAAATRAAEATAEGVILAEAIEGPAPLPRGWDEALEATRAKYTGELAESFDRAARRCASMGLSLDDAKAALETPTTFFILGEDPKGLLQLDEIAKAHKLKGLQRVAEYVCGLHGAGAKAPALLDKSVLKVIAEADGVIPPRFLQMLSKTDDVLKLSPDVVAIAIREVRAFASASPWARGLYVGGVAAEVVSVGMDYYSYREAKLRADNTIANMERSLAEGGFEKRGNTFRHDPSGCTVEVKSLEKSITALQNEEYATLIGGGTLSAISLAPSIALGPGGLVILGAQLILRTAANVANYFNDAGFLQKTPAAVLALLSTEGTVGKSNKDVIDTYYTDKGLLSTGTEKQLRKKMFCLMFAREVQGLARDNPDLAMEILQGRDMSTLLDDRNSPLFGADFERVLQPYIAARMFQRSHDGNENMPSAGKARIIPGVAGLEDAIRLNSSLTWEQAKQLSTYDHYFDWGENVDDQTLAETMRETTMLYAQHCRELRLRREEAGLQQLVSSERPAALSTKEELQSEVAVSLQRAVYERMHTQEKKEYIFGTTIESLPDSVSANGKTTVERSLEAYTKRLDALAKEGLHTKSQMLKKDPQAFAVENVLPSSDKAVNLGSLAALSLRGNVEATLDQATRDMVIKKAEEVQEELELVGYLNRAAGLDDFNILLGYASLLEQHPSLDPDSWIRKQVYAMRQYRWGERLAEGSVKRDEAFSATVRNLLLHIRMLKSRPAADFSKEEMDKGYDTIDVTANKRQWLPHVRDASSLTVLGGNQELKGIAGQTISFTVVNVGQVTCESKLVNGAASYQWYVTPFSNFRGSCDFVTKDYDTTSWRHSKIVKELKLRAHDKEGYYTRDGYTGTYILQPDGSAFYSGGKNIKTGKEYKGSTYYPTYELKLGQYKLTAPGTWFKEGAYGKAYEGKTVRHVRIQGPRPKTDLAMNQ